MCACVLGIMIVCGILCQVMGLAVAAAAVAEGAIVAPPWADPGNNPCASQPGGWQLLYWPGDGKCYKIFHQGPPCPPSMELTPGVNRTAHCRCPPGAAQSQADSLCYALFTTQPCQSGEYFAPVPSQQKDGLRWGVCRQAPSCRAGELFYPRDGRCYPHYSQGPCPRGQLLAPGYPASPLGECRCDDNGRLGRYYWPAGGTCHPHFTAGPCQEKGTLFLPEGRCGCHPGLQQYHPATKLCYQLGAQGPCAAGHQFSVSEQQSDAGAALTEPVHAVCRCKDGHVQWPGDGACYRPYTRGPCTQGEMFSVNLQEGNTSVWCAPVPCRPGRLYFPGGKGCHRVGTRGPCPPGQVVLFQEAVKTSVEGISYQGMCGCVSRTPDSRSFYPQLRADDRSIHSSRCEAQGRSETNTLNTAEMSKLTESEDTDRCSSKRGYITWSDGRCQQLYVQGPCAAGQWVVADHSKGRRRGRGSPWRQGKCECLPSFTSAIDHTTGKLTCHPPAVGLADYLNRQADAAAA